MRAVGGSSSAKVMPRKKKNGQSPARQPHGPPEGGRPVGYPAPQRYDFHQSSAEKENILKTMQEMFSHLDPEVIHIVLSECDFKVENAMDSLLELSGAAEGVTPQPPPVSGFERTAAALLSPHHFSQPNPDGHPFGTAHCSSSLSSTNLLMEDLDLLIDRELETLAEQRDVKDETPGSISSSLPLFPLPPAPQQALPELLQSSMEAASKERFTTQTSLSGGQVEDWSGVSSPLNQLSTWGDEVLGTQKDVLDFTHLTTESYTDKSKPPLDLAASGRPSAFQVYKKQETSKTVPESTAPTYSDSLATGARSKASLLNSNPHGYGSSSWNLGAPEFCRQVQGSQRPTFITPVAQGPSCWLSPSRLASPWLNTGPISQSPLKPSAVLKSWALSAAPQAPALHSRLQLQGKVLVLLRGAPGSGKSTLARALLEHNPGGVVLSTDDYFNHGGRYRFDPMVLGEAHEWNHKRARESFERGINPIIIDNTNMQGWEMKPYVVQALKHGYKVLFKEPDTWWKSKPRELERRTAHNVPVETIRRMLNGYDRFVTVQSIMSSHMPEFKPALLQENCHSLPGSADTPCPDLVDRSRLNVECKSFHPQLYSSLPDVSSISGSEDAGMPDGASCESTESLDLQLLGKQTSRPDAFDAEDIYSGEVHSEQNPTKREGRIPDCIVESVMNEDHSDEVPVAFSESIAQRVKRERSQRSGFDQTEAADLVKDTNSSDKDTSTDEQAEEEMVGKGEEKRNSEMLDFVGDWPSEESLQQRPVKRGERHTATQGKKIGDDEKSKIVKSGPDITELRKLLDLIQTGVVTDQMSSSCSLSPSSGEELEKQDEGGKVEKVNKTEERQQNRSKPGLPDCVQDWKANESHNSTGCCEGVESENKANTNTERISDSSETGKELLEPTDVCSDQVGNKDADLTEIRRSQGAESNMKQVSEGPESPASELFVEAESFGSSQEKKQRQGRRSGKQCKLALTFSHNSSMNDSDCSNTAAENTDTKNISNSDAKAISSDLKPDLDLLCPSRPELPTAFASVETSCFCQTEPQDFALLWRLNRRHGPDGAVVSGHSGNVQVLEGNSSSFVPWLSSTASAVNSSSVTEVPYRVVHEKGTQLEEKELGVTQNRLESLRILSRHFKLVSFDTLEDLYDKCSQDLEWTTNLLLDSGERFFRDEDCDDIQPSSRAEALSEVSDTGECLEPVRECESKGEVTGAKEAAQELTHETERASNEGNKNADIPFGGGSVSVIDDEQSEPASDQEPVPHTEPSPPEAVELERSSDTDLLVTDADFEDGAWGRSVDILDFETETTDDIASMDEINRLLQAELEEMEREQSQRKAERQSQHLNIQTVELKLSTELALQLTELFGPVGVDPGTCSADDFAVLMDLNLAKLLHQKWKETIQERQRQAALSFQLLEEKQTHPGSSPMSKNGDMSLAGQPDSSSRIPFMDHWNVSRPHVSLRDIIKEEQVLQANMQKTRQSRVDLHRWDGATLLKEKQLYQLFPTIDKHFLQDIFRDHNYSLTQTELFLRSLLNEDEPVKMVVAPEAPRSDQHRAASKEREKKQKSLASAVPNYQDTDDPEYEDFRAEANLQRRRQLENFAKAAEAFRQGRKEVASFYAQQGHLHGQRMREANHRAAVQIFERVNSSLLPRNILDLHGLHVNEALEHLAQVLEEKTAECEQGLCQPQLSVITGRGNHSQGGVARIRPAVIDYLTNKHYRFSEPKPGLVLVSLK